jgi:tetrahydromethanopterin S-methyltransferase subunit B
MMDLPIALASTDRTMWYVALGAGLVVAIVVAALLALLLSFVKNIEASVSALLDLAGKVAANTQNIPQLEALPPVLEQIREEAKVQDGYMNALSQGYTEAPGSGSTDSEPEAQEAASAPRTEPEDQEPAAYGPRSTGVPPGRETDEFGRVQPPEEGKLG